MTNAQQRALRFLHKGGGSGVIDKYGRLLVAGETEGFNPQTWLRLVASGHVKGEDGRICITKLGSELLRAA